MPRYIDADALLERAIPMGWSTPLWVSDIMIKDAPTADVVERKKGEWIMKWHCFLHSEVPMCSQCLKFSPLKYDFCPKCGADMRKEEQDG